jgi:hypothetical protein
MPDYEFVSENDDYMEVIADANFGGQLSSPEILEILDAVHTAITLGVGANIFLEGLKFIAISETSISIGLRFSRKEVEKLPPQERDELPIKMSRFLMYCFANIDKIHLLSETPFPNFRLFDNMSAWL